jgi:hypothetical protein
LVDVRSVDGHCCGIAALLKVPSKPGVYLGNQTFVAHPLRDPRALSSLSDVDTIYKESESRICVAHQRYCPSALAYNETCPDQISYLS